MCNKHDNFMKDIDRRVAKLDVSIDEAVDKFDKLFPVHINEEIASIQANLAAGIAPDAPFSGDRYVFGVCCKTQAEYNAAWAKHSKD